MECKHHDLPLMCGVQGCGMDDWDELERWEPGRQLLHYPKGTFGGRHHHLIPAHKYRGKVVVCGLLLAEPRQPDRQPD